MEQLAKAFRRPHVHDGEYSTFRRRRFGAPAEDVPPHGFVVFSANHDQIGNRALRRPAAARGPAARRDVHAVLAVRPDRLPGRGVRGGRAVPVLHRPHRRGHRGGHPQGAPAGVRRPSPRSRARTSRTRRRSRRSRRSKLTRVADPEIATCTGGCSRCGASCRPATWTRRRRGRPLAARAPRRPGRSWPTSAARGRVPLEAPRVEIVVATHDADRLEAAGRPAAAARRGARQVSREVWPGRPFPLGSHLGRPGHQLLPVLRARDARRAVPVRRRRPRGAHPGHRPHGAQLALLPARRRSRHSATATACTGPTSPRRATASTRPSC